VSMNDEMDLSARLKQQAAIPETPPLREFIVRVEDEHGLLSNEVVQAHSMTVQDGCLGLHVISYSPWHKALVQSTVKVYNCHGWERVDEVIDANATVAGMPSMPAGALLN